MTHFLTWTRCLDRDRPICESAYRQALPGGRLLYPQCGVSEAVGEDPAKGEMAGDDDQDQHGQGNQERNTATSAFSGGEIPLFERQCRQLVPAGHRQLAEDAAHVLFESLDGYEQSL